VTGLEHISDNVVVIDYVVRYIFIRPF